MKLEKCLQGLHPQIQRIPNNFISLTSFAPVREVETLRYQLLRDPPECADAEDSMVHRRATPTSSLP